MSFLLGWISLQLFISGLISQMEKSKAELIRKYRITEALLNKSREPKRIAALDAKRSHLRQREKIFNENVQVRTISQQIAPLKHSRPLLQFINREKDWFEKSPAFKMAQAYIQENWIKCKSGAWMHKVRSTLFVRQYPTPCHKARRRRTWRTCKRRKQILRRC